MALPIADAVQCATAGLSCTGGIGYTLIQKFGNRQSQDWSNGSPPVLSNDYSALLATFILFEGQTGSCNNWIIIPPSTYSQLDPSTVCYSLGLEPVRQEITVVDTVQVGWLILLTFSSLFAIKMIARAAKS